MFAAAAALISGAIHSQEISPAITEDRAVEAGMARAPIAQLLTAEREIARSEVLHQGRFPAPSLIYRQEDAGGSEQTMTVASDLDISGRRGLLMSAAQRRLSATEQELHFQRQEIAFEIRHQFYETLADRIRVDALSRWTARMAEMVEVVRKLQAGGEASGYDRRRLEREQITAAARLASAGGELAAGREILSALTGLTPPIDLAGQLLPGAGDFALDRIAERGDIAALSGRAEAARMELRAADRWWFPVLSLEAGTKTVPSDSGSVLGVSVRVPLLTRDRDLALRARSEALAADARREILLTRATAEARGRAAQAEQLRGAAERLTNEALPSSEQLVRTAEASYRAGEIGILELLDAYRTLLDAELELIDMSMRARQAQLQLQFVAGGALP